MGHILDIDGAGYFLHIRNGCFIATKDNATVLSVHPSDVASVIFHGNQQTVSAAFLGVCAENNIPVVFCDEKHTPASMLLPFNTHFKSAERMETQINASVPIKKQIWQMIVKEKLKNQASLLLFMNHQKEAGKIFHIAELVRSGDTSNCEAQGARLYFQTLFGKEFRRGQSDIINVILDYTYTILRSCIAREIVGAGLNPAFSIFHSNKSNAFALVDDLMEPFRPLADRYAILIYKKYDGCEELSPSIKQACIGITKHKVLMQKQEQEFPVAIENYIYSYISFLRKGSKNIVIPTIDYDFTL
ncbi:MAG: type II CRISPR-associated endonuclease Cas1 [Treponema sp.]|nr:type II CRISPR-associated endonuclease Cas1 [Treponema sp.]MBP5452852.1 type II CRISPR-associated endonuclease Cas1 [Treponema sp.]